MMAKNKKRKAGGVVFDNITPQEAIKAAAQVVAQLLGGKVVAIEVNYDVGPAFDSGKGYTERSEPVDVDVTVRVNLPKRKTKCKHPGMILKGQRGNANEYCPDCGWHPEFSK